MTSIVIDMFRKAEVMTDMNSEHVDVLNAKIATLTAERDEAMRISESYKCAHRGTQEDCSTIAFILSQYIDEYGTANLDKFIMNSVHDVHVVEDLLVAYDAVDPRTFRREWSVTISIPVTVTVEVEAKNEDDAEEAARDLIDMNGIESYNMDYNTYYDMEVVEVRDI